MRPFCHDVALEVASPGAERKLRLPGDLTRFSELTMRVTYKDAEAEDHVDQGADAQAGEELEAETYTDKDAVTGQEAEANAPLDEGTAAKLHDDSESTTATVSSFA